jgi:formylglycine-generating enzyme required for sulfatase activity
MWVAEISKEKIMQKKLDLEFVLIPAGEFEMGADRSRDRHAPDDEKPCHVLNISDYYIMRYPVSNLQYSLFCQETGHRAPLTWKEGGIPDGKTDHPVVGVSYHDGVAFCSWAAGVTGLAVRLPTEPEWEKAARGPDGRTFPWGNIWDPQRCNCSDLKTGGTTPLGLFSPAGDSPYQVAETGGNVQEWTSSLFGRYPYDPQDGREVLVNNISDHSMLPRLHETGCVASAEMIEAYLGKSVIRGGSWRESKEQSRCTYRSWAAPMHRSDDTGFRCCYEA